MRKLLFVSAVIPLALVFTKLFNDFEAPDRLLALASIGSQRVLGFGEAALKRRGISNSVSGSAKNSVVRKGQRAQEVDEWTDQDDVEESDFGAAGLTGLVESFNRRAQGLAEISVQDEGDITVAHFLFKSSGPIRLDTALPLQLFNEFLLEVKKSAVIRYLRIVDVVAGEVGTASYQSSDFRKAFFHREYASWIPDIEYVTRIRHGTVNGAVGANDLSAELVLDRP